MPYSPKFGPDSNVIYSPIWQILPSISQACFQNRSNASRKDAAKAAEPVEAPFIDDGMSPFLGDDVDFDAVKTLALAAPRADAREHEAALVECKTGSPQVAASTDDMQTAKAVEHEPVDERKSKESG